MTDNERYLSAAEVAIYLSSRARTALVDGKKEAAVALVEVGHAYAFLAEADVPLPRDGGIKLPYTATRLPVPRATVDGGATDTVTPRPEAASASASGTTTTVEGPTGDGEDRIDDGGDDEDTDGAVPRLLLRAYHAVLAAGGAMYGTDLAEVLGVRAQQVGKDMTKILRDVGISRPNNGTVRPTAGEPYRNGYLAETFAAAIAAYRVRAELADVA
ncbi:hypothetical protein [Streptomyces lasiicapitis]|uniref:Uncharacterized protein n=1 Tax=Streptomyces lasiicapitis TaxID=1923961 RepID=A0ABQ2LRK1_9ACTN|nr:hypothetical protein [Streptomyces lasiicapitis]GGO42470.1 hypothetical protein GCM10012286_24000 [Streptomyces lasiicapitis]